MEQQPDLFTQPTAVNRSRGRPKATVNKLTAGERASVSRRKRLATGLRLDVLLSAAGRADWQALQQCEGYIGLNNKALLEKLLAAALHANQNRPAPCSIKLGAADCDIDSVT